MTVSMDVHNIDREFLYAMGRVSGIDTSPYPFLSEGETNPSLGHIWEVPGNYPVFTMVIEIYHFVERIWRIIVTPDFSYNISDHEKILFK